jgi:hypothetical protein
MWKVLAKVLASALVVCTLCPAPARALELKNMRAVYGPFGSERADNKFLHGDVLYVAYDIADLKVEEKAGTIKYSVAIEQTVVDSKGGLTFQKSTKNQDTLSLGGKQMPGIAELLIGKDQAPGKYTLKLKVQDLLSKDTKEISYAFEVVPENFGFVRLFAPVAGLTGQQYVANFAVGGMARDAKKKPNVNIRMQILDEAGKPVHSQPHTMDIPKDLPEELASKIDALPFVDLQFPLYLNRPGRFTIELEGTDAVAKKTAKLRFPLTVIDPGSIGAK